ncbi:MAG: hypothetical protein V3V41_02125 [Candidatus Heimdallarchaeota archaeon]
MPGKGDWWNVGGLNNKVVTEADLSDALQTKVNNISGGTGNSEVILDTTFGSDLISHSFNFSRSITLDGSDVSKIVIIFHPIKLSAFDILDITFNGEGFSGSTRGLSSDGASVTAVNQGFISDGIGFEVTSGAIKLELVGDIRTSSGNTGFFARWSDQDHYSTGNINMGSEAINPLVSVQIRTRNGVATLNSASRVVAYAINKD